MSSRTPRALAVLLLTIFAAARANAGPPTPAREPYFGQASPGDSAVLFAPGIVSTGLNEGQITFTPDGRECYWSIAFSGFETIVTSRLEKGVWTEPEVAAFSGRHHDGWPWIQPDGRRLFFHSARPLCAPGDSCARYNVWYVDRDGRGWSEPRPVGAPVNGRENSTAPSVARDGTLYFSKRFPDGSEKVCRSRLARGAYAEVETLPAVINSARENFHAVVSPDGSFLVLPARGREGAGSGWNYYVSFHDDSGGWSGPVNLGRGVNALVCGGIPALSADGKYLFLQAWAPKPEIWDQGRRRTLAELRETEVRDPSGYTLDVYWVDARIIEALRPRPPR